MLHLFVVFFIWDVVNGHSIRADDVVLTLCTRNSSALNLTDENLNMIDTSKETVYIVHGWKSKPNASWVVNMTSAYLERGDYNVIRVGWTNISSSNYVSSYSKVPGVGRAIASCILLLAGSSEKFLDKVHLVGHSLGAHICGYVGQSVFREAFYRLSRITGLDPAGLGYDRLIERSIHHRLSKDDAQFVDIIHTNRGVFGFSGVLGSVDFYPNDGGPVQPGCGVINQKCSHKRAYKYFTESILSQNFVARNCRSWKYYVRGRCDKYPKTVMGEDVSRTATGKYYLKTNSQYPFAEG